MDLNSQKNISSAILAKIRKRLSELPNSESPIYESKDQSIFRFQVDHLDLIAKFYEMRSMRQKLAAFFKRSRADRSYRAGLYLLKAGINTPRPILLSKQGKSQVLVTEFCPHKALRESLVDGEDVPDSVPANVLSLLHQLKQNRLTHGDFHARNLLIAPDGTPHLIDLDGVRFHARPLSCRRDRDRFLVSIQPIPTYYSMFTAILGKSGDALPSLNTQESIHELQ